MFLARQKPQMLGEICTHNGGGVVIAAMAARLHACHADEQLLAALLGLRELFDELSILAKAH